MAKKKKKTVKRVKKAQVRKVKKAKASRKKTAKKAVKKAPELGLEKIGEVTHYFPHVNAAAVLLLKDGLKVGDEIYLKGHTTDFKEKVRSIQLDHVSIQEGRKAQEIGLLVKSRVRIGDSVYRI
ncbi:MAG: hypothetical protein V1927_03895 [Candidatus Omnitrophota bacterium]